MVRVLVVDDNPITRMGLISMLETSDEIEVVGEAVNGQQAIEMASARRPDVVLLDVKMPIMGGISAAAHLSRASRVLMLTDKAYDVDDVTKAAKAGASGYLILRPPYFDAEELVRAVLGTAEGQSFLSPLAASLAMIALRQAPSAAGSDAFDLTPQERKIMELIAQGLSNPEIATKMYLAEKTVANYINRIYRKLGAASRGHAIALWLGSAPSDPSG